MLREMSLDEQLYKMPIIGILIRRLYSYFKRNTAITDGMHIALGLGIGLLFAGEEFYKWAALALLIGVLGHIYALIKG